MTREEIYNKANKVIGLEGMTGNERLWESGLMDEFDRVKKTDIFTARTILEALKFDELSINRMVGNSMETLKHPNPWVFPTTINSGKNIESNATIKYLNINEVGMGAPLSGSCELEINGRNYKIDSWCGGQPIWNNEGTKAAIPLWTKSFWKGTIQKIGILDTEKLTLTKYSRTFRVLDFRSFQDSIIIGFDSPIHKTKSVEFNIDSEKIEEQKKL